MNTNDELERLLERARFQAPPLDTLWTPQREGVRWRWPSRMLVLAGAVLALALAGVALAASGFVPAFLTERGTVDCQPDECGSGYHAVAHLEDRTGEAVLLAFNVVVADDQDREAITAIATGFADRHHGSRVIVYAFSVGSADSHFGFGLMPSTDQEPAPPPVNLAGWMATFDFAPSGTHSEVWAYQSSQLRWIEPGTRYCDQPSNSPV